MISPRGGDAAAPRIYGSASVAVDVALRRCKLSMKVSISASVSIYFLQRSLQDFCRILAVLGGFLALRFVFGEFGDLQIYGRIHVGRVRLAARLHELGSFVDLQFVSQNRAKIYLRTTLDKGAKTTSKEPPNTYSDADRCWLHVRSILTLLRAMIDGVPPSMPGTFNNRYGKNDNNNMY